MEKLSHDAWLERCARRISQLDAGIDDREARRIARAMKSFERTGVMPPEAAADFVSRQMSSPGHRFERRSAARR